MADLVGTVRVHPEDDPADPAARRVIRTDRPVELCWQLITGVDGGRPGADWRSRSDTEIGLGTWGTPTIEWPVQGPRSLAAALGHDQRSDRAPVDPRAAVARLDTAILALADHPPAALAPWLEDLTEALGGLEAVVAHLPDRSPTPGGTP